MVKSSAPCCWLDVTVTDFESQDVGKAIFLGDEIELKGRAEFADATRGQQTGAYFVENSFAWGGFLGAAMMSDAEVSLSKGFAERPTRARSDPSARAYL